MASTVATVDYPTNINKVTLSGIALRDADKYFNNFFNIPVEVTSNIDSTFIAYFEQIADNKESAKALASAVIYTSIKQGLNPMTTLDEFKKLPPGELDAYTALFLNFERKGTSYLGISNRPVQNQYIQRTIIK